MKKIFTIAAALFAALSINAQESITCAKAVELMPAQAGDATEAEYIVTGYVTQTNGAISPSKTDPSINQQCFYIDDEKGSKKTVNCYWCDLPDGEAALNKGDKVTVQGKIMNYNGEPEFKNGKITILERAQVSTEVIEANVCEALEEGSSLNKGDYSDETFAVFGRLKGVDSGTNGKHTFEMACGDQVFKPYNCTGAEGLELGKGDSVKVTGKLYNYNGVIEISGGTVELIEKSGSAEVVHPVTVAEALALISQMEKGATTDDRYAVTGFVVEIETEFSEQYENISFYMADDAASQARDFLAYRVKVSKDDASKVVIGAKVKVTAVLQRYYKAASGSDPEKDIAETTAGGTIEFLGTAVEDVFGDTRSIKRIENGQIVIIRDGNRYNLLGTELR